MALTNLTEFRGQSTLIGYQWESISMEGEKGGLGLGLGLGLG